MAQPPPEKRDPKAAEKTATGAAPKPGARTDLGGGAKPPGARDASSELKVPPRLDISGEFKVPPRSPASRDISGEFKIPPRSPGGGPAPANGKPPPRSGSTGVAAIDLGGAKNAKEFHKHIHNSTFSERTTFGSQAAAQADDEEEESTQVGLAFDGNTPANEVTAREPWKVVNAPLQSREGRRSVKLYEQVLNQFAVGANPRYEPDAPDKPRGHIFLWDVSRALNVEVPHFVGSRELSLPQTCMWIRDQGPLRGWHQVDVYRAQEAANAGQPVVVMPKDVKQSQLGLMRPGPLAPDNKPFISTAARARGNGLTVQQAFGVHAVVYYFHA